MKVDFLIVGQGLAGSLLSWFLLERRQRILVVDRDETETSSKVAAGLVTPVAGSRFNLPDGLARNLVFAKQFYWNLEEKSGERLFHHLRIARLFRDENEAGAWRSRIEHEPETYRPFHAPLRIDPDLVRAKHGGFEMLQGGWLDVPVFLELTRQHLLERAAYAVGRVRSDEVIVETGAIRWKNVEAGTIVFCQGWRGNRNRFFDWLPMNPARGDILDLRIPELADEDRILSKGGWMLPTGEGEFRAGSTYEHDFADASPSDKGKEEVLEKVRSIVPVEPQVISHRSAIRPIVRRSQVVMGVHPTLSRVAFFNGLGSKGVLNGPWHADRLAAHLVEQAPLPEAADLRANQF